MGQSSPPAAEVLCRAVGEALETLLEGSGFEFVLIADHIIIRKSASVEVMPSPALASRLAIYAPTSEGRAAVQPALLQGTIVG